MIEYTKSHSELTSVRFIYQTQRKFCWLVRDQIMSIYLISLTLHLLVVFWQSMKNHGFVTEELHTYICITWINWFQMILLLAPKLKFKKEHVCEACQKGKQTKQYFKLKNFVSTSKPLELLHMDLFGPSRTMSLGGNYYALVVADYFSRFIWTIFLH